MNVLVVSCFGIGDIVMTTSAVSRLINNGHKVWLVCENIGAELIESGDPTVSDLAIIPYERVNGNMPEDLKERVLNHNVVFDLAVLTVPSNNNEGLKIVTDNVETFYYKGRDEWELRRFNHTVELNNRLLDRGLKQIEKPSRYRLDFDGEYRPRLDARRALMHVGAQNSFWRYKAFPLKLFREIGNFLKESSWEVGIIGDDQQTIYAKMLPEFTDYTGIPIKETKQLMRESLAFIGNDCGPAHLAAALGMDTVVFFGPTYHERTAPWPLDDSYAVGGRNRIIQSIVPCGPCHMTERFTECRAPVCHDQVSLADFKLQWSGLYGGSYGG